MNQKEMGWGIFTTFWLTLGGFSLSILIEFPYFLIPIFLFVIAFFGIYKFGLTEIERAYGIGKLESLHNTKTNVAKESK